MQRQRVRCFWAAHVRLVGSRAVWDGGAAAQRGALAHRVRGCQHVNFNLAPQRRGFVCLGAAARVFINYILQAYLKI